MPTLEEELHREPHLFEKEQEQEHAQEHAAASRQELLKVERAGLEVKREQEAALRPEAAAELAQHAESSDHAVEKLFEHFAEQQGPDDDEEEAATSTQVDVRQRGRNESESTVREQDDVFDEGVEGDFQRDAKVVIGELDTHPASGDVTDEIQRKRRRRVRIEDPLALPETEPSRDGSEQSESKQDKG
jgi:hypothetical protein